MASVSGVLPEQDTATTASAAPTQPGSRSARETTTWTGLLSPAMALSISPARPELPMPATTMARGLPSAAKAGQVGFRARPQRGAHLGRRRGHLPQHVTGIGRLDHVGRVEPVRGQDELGPAPAVQVVAHCFAGSPGRLASSTSSTGISSRTG